MAHFEDINTIHESEFETSRSRRGAARWIDCQLPGEEVVQTKADRASSVLDETDTMFVSGEALFSRIYESMREVGMYGVRQIRTEKPTEEK